VPAVPTLDDAALLAGRDPGGMLAMVAGFPSQLARAPEARDTFRAAHADPGVPAGITSVLVCGMGGSAIGGDMAAAWAAPRGVRLAVHRGYGLPAWVDRETLLVFSSYSGNTEETLDAFDASGRVGAPRLAVATGGALAARARAAGVPLLLVPPGLQPRAALGHSLVALLVLLHAAGLVDDPLPDLAGAARRLEGLASRCRPESPEAANPAKRLARAWHGRLPVFYTGPGLLAPAGVRWRGQVNENAKSLAIASVLPELDHNEIMGWQALPDVRRAICLVFLRDADDAGPVALRMQVTADILADRAGALEWVDAPAGARLERLLGTTYLGDWASVYLAFLNGVDPTPVAEIDQLKRRLSEAARG
jgi:glucose/mannose-6-phosphate isomerase